MELLFLNLPEKVSFENIEQGLTYQVEIDEQTGFQEKLFQSLEIKN